MPRRRVPIRQSELVRRFAERLRELRLSRGMTQAELARAASVTPSYLSRLEGAKIAPGLDMVERLAATLGVVPTDLLPTAPTADPLPVLKQQARRLLNELLELDSREPFLHLNPIIALVVEAASKRGPGRPA